MNKMSSWRNQTSEQAQADLDGLLNAALPFAQQMLADHGEFYPYGVTLSVSGESGMIAGHPGGERPPATEVLSTILDGLKGQRDNLRAVALVADVRYEGSDAIRIELEHREGIALAVLLPYKRKRFGRGIDYAALQAANPQLWV